jgi:hypothetical protein
MGKRKITIMNIHENELQHEVYLEKLLGKAGESLLKAWRGRGRSKNV